MLELNITTGELFLAKNNGNLQVSLVKNDVYDESVEVEYDEKENIYIIRASLFQLKYKDRNNFDYVKWASKVLHCKIENKKNTFEWGTVYINYDFDEAIEEEISLDNSSILPTIQITLNKEKNIIKKRFSKEELEHKKIYIDNESAKNFENFSIDDFYEKGEYISDKVIINSESNQIGFISSHEIYIYNKAFIQDYKTVFALTLSNGDTARTSLEYSPSTRYYIDRFLGKTLDKDVSILNE